MLSWIDGKRATFNEFTSLVETSKIDVNYLHSETQITILMAATISGNLQVVEKLLALGANVYLKACNDLTALEWAKRFAKSEIIELLECYQ